MGMCVCVGGGGGRGGADWESVCVWWWWWGGGGYVDKGREPLTLHRHHQNDLCVKTGSDILLFHSL